MHLLEKLKAYLKDKAQIRGAFEGELSSIESSESITDLHRLEGERFVESYRLEGCVFIDSTYSIMASFSSERAEHSADEYHENQILEVIVNMSNDRALAYASLERGVCIIENRGSTLGEFDIDFAASYTISINRGSAREGQVLLHCSLLGEARINSLIYRRNF